VASPSLIGGLALVVATIGAATAGQAVSAGHDVSRASAQQGGAYVATLSGASLEGRNATRVSRAGIRPLLTNDAAATTAAQRRTSRLNDAAGVAEDYAQELADQRREILREAARAARVNALADDEWVMPTSGYDISTWFGESGASWSSGYHTGIDFATAYGTPGVAVANATVVQTGWDGAYGNQVRLQLENGDEVWYNHLSSIDVVSGQSVVKGQQVGRIGDTGNSYGAHLHFEYRLASNLSDGVDPRPYLLEHGLAL
jgi:murein DD-endopeptidase MepM/ murein hydrolase activator NlpD